MSWYRCSRQFVPTRQIGRLNFFYFYFLGPIWLSFWLVNISRGFVAIVTLKTIQECCRVCNKSYFFLCLNLRQYDTFVALAIAFNLGRNKLRYLRWYHSMQLSHPTTSWTDGLLHNGQWYAPLTSFDFIWTEKYICWNYAIFISIYYKQLVSIYLCGIYCCVFYTLLILNQVYLILSKSSAGW
jgi:hypothetical protein